MKLTVWLSLLLSFMLLPLGCATTRQHVKIGMVPDLSNPASVVAVLGPVAFVAPVAVVARVAAAAARAPVVVQDRVEGRNQVGTASYYHSFFDGRLTANGQRFSNQLLTAASRTLDFGTRVRVTNLHNLKSVVVTINDRGPYVDGRIIDLSQRAANALGFVHEGVARVRIERL